MGEIGGACLVDAPTGDTKAQVTGKAPAEITAGLAEIVGTTVGEEEAKVDASQWKGTSGWGGGG